MSNSINNKIDEEIRTKSESFLKKIDSEMYYKSDFSGDALSFEWVDQIESACPFLDNIFRKPKLALIREENTVKVEKAKRITVDSIKDLSKHTNYIERIDKKTQDVEPSKILDIRNEETYNIYENRFLYTLLDILNKFIYQKEQELKSLEMKNNKNLEYSSTAYTETEKVDIEIKLTSNTLPKDDSDDKLKKEIETIMIRIKRIKEYVTSWERCDMVKALDKEHVAFINPPIKKTNIFLKNPNFKVAAKLYTYLQNYGYTNKENLRENIETDGDNLLKGFLDSSFLIDYMVLDSISKYKREQKERLTKYSVYVLTQEVYRTLSLLNSSGIKMSEDKLINLLTQSLKQDASKRLVGTDDVKKKFQSAMEEYLERTKDYL